MTKVFIGAIITMALAIAALFYQLNTVSEKAQALEASVAGFQQSLDSEKQLRQSNDAAFNARLKSAEANRTKSKEVKDAATKAIAENPEWSGSRVPDSVIDAIGM